VECHRWLGNYSEYREENQLGLVSRDAKVVGYVQSDETEERNVFTS